jgi:alpha-L-rhamnosidase
VSPRVWSARWISYGQPPSEDLGVFRFRREFQWADGPARVLVSADQRFRLYLNGRLVGEGPSRGDLQHWSYETIDLQPAAGKNVLEAVVWSYGRYAPMAQHTVRLAFLLEGAGLDTPGGWQVRREAGRGFEMMHEGVGPFYIDVGPGETLDPAEPEPWREPNVAVHAQDRGAWSGDSPWMLVPAAVPAMVREPFEGKVQTVDATTGARRPFVGEAALPLTLDFGELVAAYPKFEFTGSPGTEVRISYAEAARASDGSEGDRNDVRGKKVSGYHDRVRLGEGKTVFEPLWWRTWRYLQIDADGPAAASLSVEKTGYPYAVESRFECSEPWVERLWEVGIRTARLCAGETYFDCPYYEQLQYVGDTRIQALLHQYLSRDRRLVRHAADQFSWSIGPDGLTQSRYPSRVQQVIPGFSLWWIVQLYDLELYDSILSDSSLRAERRRQVAGVLAGYDSAASDGPQHWPFLDWVAGFGAGMPPGGLTHPASRALRALAGESAERLFPGIGGRVALESEAVEPTPHEAALRRCLELAEGRDPSPWPAKTAGGPCSLYFQFYEHQARQPEDYLASLDPWRRMIDIGLTTFAETEEPTRSDCHAWSAHPLIGLFQQVAGITSVAPGWTRARVAPRPGRLAWFDAEVAHPSGPLRVTLRDGDLTVDSPVPYELVWKGRSGLRPAGRHTL